MDKILKPLLLVFAISTGFFAFKYFEGANKISKLEADSKTADSISNYIRTISIDTLVSNSQDTFRINDPNTSTIVIYDFVSGGSPAREADVTVYEIEHTTGITKRCFNDRTNSRGIVTVDSNCNGMNGHYLVDVHYDSRRSTVRTKSDGQIKELTICF